VQLLKMEGDVTTLTLIRGSSSLMGDWQKDGA
jgi:hypothetical protein